jgi:DNA-binding LacI/PurR family transcriptional regulator
MAYTVLEFCERLRISVPEELSVVGYDGIPWHAATKHTAASVRVDFDGLADAGIKILDEIIRGKRTEPVGLVLPVKFQEGTSLGEAPQKR